MFFHKFKYHSTSILTKLDITKVDANILLTLKDNNELNKQSLANALSFKSHSLTRSIDRMIEKKLIQRITHPDDRRHIKLSLTTDGKNKAQEYMMAMEPF